MKSFADFHELKKTPQDLLFEKLRTYRDKVLQDLLNNKKLRTSVGEQDADGKTFLVGWQNLSRPTDPPTVFCLAREVGSVRREGCVVGSVHQASVGEQDADGKPVCCVRLKLDEKNPSSDHQASVGEQDAGGKPVCCDWAPAVDGTNQYAFREDCVVGSVRREGCVVGVLHQASVGEQDAGGKPVCWSPSEAWWTENNTRLKLDKNPSSDDDDDDLYG